MGHTETEMSCSFWQCSLSQMGLFSGRDVGKRL